MNQKNALFAAMGVAILFAFGCTKQLDYDYQPHYNVEEKSSIDTTSTFLYVPSITKSSRTSDAARPYWVGESKQVKFRFKKGSLQVVEVETDPRFKDNEANLKIVMEIPIEDVDFHCAKDRFGECTNKEEENKDLTPEQRSKFKPDFDHVAITEANLLPLEMEKVFGSNCYTEVASKSVGYKIEGDALNFQLEKTFQVAPNCIKGDLEDLSALTVTGIYHYSFAKLSTLASVGYQPINYPQSDEGDFGFFTTTAKKLDVDFGDTVASEKIYMNRWNPAKDVVTYYLSKEFTKPENAPLRRATFLGVERLNNGLKASGANFHIELKDADGRIPGDIRYSFIIMVEDPIASSILGYGPVIADPRTGEIVSGRTVMYPGVMKQYIRWTYDQILQEQQQPKSATGGLKMSAQMQSMLTSVKEASGKGIAAMKINGSHVVSKKINNGSIASLKIDQIKDAVLGKKMAKMLSSDKRSDLALMSKYCTYPAELFNFNQALTASLKTNLKVDSLKPWEKMSEDEKQTAIDVILPEIWVPTLVHEMGHNLGLRHNFKGSEDKANFYSQDELAKMGINQAIPYSSVMDYPYSDLNMLPTMGKYDIAALRFAYTRQVETVDGKLVQVANTLEDLKKSSPDVKLKDFQYCTDEHVEVNIGCKRFDEGTTLTEMAQHAVKSYEEAYARRNFRRSRRSFSLRSDAQVISRLQEDFGYIRFNFETMSRIKQSFGVDYDSDEWNKSEFLKDLKQATLLSGKFLVNVLLTPDQTCVIGDSKTKEIVQAVALSDIDPNALDCGSLTLKDQYFVAGSVGKSFHSKKDPSNNNPYMDQIDVRGIWLDKVMAAHILLDRTIGNSSWDKSDDNYLDMPELRESVINALADVFVGTTKVSIPTLLFNGQLLEIPITVNLASTQIIDKPLSEEVIGRLGMPDKDVRIQELMLPIIRKSGDRTAKSDSDRELNDLFAVSKFPKLAALDPSVKDQSVLAVGDWKYIAGDSNELGGLLIKQAGVQTRLAKYKPEDVRAALQKVVKGELKPHTPKATEVEKAVASEDKNLVLALVQGTMQDTDYISAMLDLLAK